MGVLRIAICDDQPSERELLGRFLRAYFAAHPYEYELTEYAGGEPLVDDYEDGCACFDLIFLDIFLDGILGMEAARSLRRFAPRVPIIFLTASPDYALESYDVRAYGYLVKPLDAGRAGALLERFLREEYDGRQKTLLLREGGRGRRIAYREIECIESRRNVLLVRLDNGEEHRVYARLDDVERELEGHGFIRCHQSYIVNMDRVRTVEDDFLMASGERVPIRQRGAKTIRSAYFEYLLSQAELTRI
ncbi:LytTR family DNA-binding domain-containing protein [Pseudoflavonifractor phocaeensis]|jgi:hypothetical protein|nr:MULTISPECIES: LytTR family DNA-binding domain-containing protein [Oscillospiraceae]MCQ4866638.1 LytTR family DNA-binding domain-containing protein [Pseudoflavonifractor phocaeensis]